jgi:hypothetical protein
MLISGPPDADFASDAPFTRAQLAALADAVAADTAATFQRMPAQLTEALGSLSGLTRLCVQHTAVVDPGGKSLCALTRLQSLALRDCSLDDLLVANLVAGLTQLSALDVAANRRVSLVPLVAVRLLPGLQELNITGTRAVSEIEGFSVWRRRCAVPRLRLRAQDDPAAAEEG